MAIFIYNKEASEPEFDQYGIFDCRDSKIYYCTKQELIDYQNEGYIIDGLPKDVRVVKKTENLQKAKKAKNDEFYTQLFDIEKELMNYDPSIFKDKVIYCPTDVAYAQGRILPSEFVHYFQMNAKRLGFKKLIATCLAEKVDNDDKGLYNKFVLERIENPDVTDNMRKAGYASEDLPDEIYIYDDTHSLMGYVGDHGKPFDRNFDKNFSDNFERLQEEYEDAISSLRREGKLSSRVGEDGNIIYHSEYIIRMTFSECEPDEDGKYGSGDFRSRECTEILKKSDIVVTNPPFSLFREFIAWLKQDDSTLKPCIVVSNKNAITYKEVFPLIRDNNLWVGSTSLNGGRWMILPPDHIVESSKVSIKTDSHGNRIQNVAGVCWFTNLPHSRRAEDMLLTERYYEEDGTTPLPDAELRYPKYDNYDAINVDKVNQIPRDYYGVMGVPITFLDKYNPDQFEIIGGFNAHTCPHEEGGYVPSTTTEYYDKNGNIKRWNGPTVNKKTTYYRVCIRRKQPKAQSE